MGLCIVLLLEEGIALRLVLDLLMNFLYLLVEFLFLGCNVDSEDADYHNVVEELQDVSGCQFLTKFAVNLKECFVG